MSCFAAVRCLASALALAALVATPVMTMAQDAGQKPGKTRGATAPTVSVGKDQKLCQYRFPDGEKRSWVCDKAQPCCAWDLIKYVKCGSTVTNCL